METIIYSIPHPFCNGRIEVYGDPDMAAYEWRIFDSDRRLQQHSQNRGYGVAEIALRDALIEAGR